MKPPLWRLGLALSLALAATAAPAAPGVGERVQLAATLPDGGRVSLADAKGRRTLLVLWSPGSLAWRKSMGEFERFAASPEAAGTLLLAIATTGGPASLREFLAARGASFGFALRSEDNLGRIDEQRLPVILVVDGEGRLLRTHSGMFTARMLRELLAAPAH